MKRCLLVLSLILSLSVAQVLPQTREKPASPGDLYDGAMELFYKGRFQEALEGFSRLIQSFPLSKLVPYAHYMMGQCYLKMERDEEAIQKFEHYLKAYPEGDRTEQSRQGLALAKERFKPKKEAPEAAVEVKPPPDEQKKAEPPVAVPPTLKEEPRKEAEETLKRERATVPEVGDRAEGVKAPIQAPEKIVAKKVKRRICAQISYLEAKTFAEVERRIKELKEAGVDTLIFRVFQNRGDRMYKFAKGRHEEGVFFKTGHAPVVDDLLGRISEIARRHGLDLFAWVTTRYATYGTDSNPAYRSRFYNFETKRMELGRGYNLFHPEVLNRLEGLFRDLGRYPLDGILIQDDLILRHNEDFSPEANRAFLKEFGYSPHPDLFYIEPYKSDSGKYYVKGYTEQFWTWARWKNGYLMSVADRLISAARESNPRLQVALNLSFETVLNDSNGMAWFSQTLSEALKRDIDYYAVMAYHRQAMKGRNIALKESIDLMAEAARKAIESVGDPHRVMMKIWILDWKSNEAVGLELAPKQEIAEILEKILKQGDVSLAFVPYTHQFPLHQLKERWARSP
ncbi:MAG: tetratricopeptide repeat protein [Desulfobacterota bacterium]|nr:tetratricopeptide repeat protein [Thermodesulfobacteriota bacterium]